MTNDKKRKKFIRDTYYKFWINSHKNLNYKIFGVNYSVKENSLFELRSRDDIDEYDRILFEIELKNIMY